MYSATYSPDDNKLRLYASSRLDSDTYNRVKAAGFKWAPKQDLFVAPMWTPDREDLLLELAGEIGDEDTSLTDRAEERAERFEEYHEKREQEATETHDRVMEICRVVDGQPILVGHHSEKRARRDQQRIVDGSRKAIALWKTSTYWEHRAKAAIAHAKYKELPAVRARRIKGLEADLRKQTKEKEEAEMFLKLWSKEGLTKERGLKIANYCHLYLPRKPEDSDRLSHNPSAYDALCENPSPLFAPRSLEEVIAAAKEAYPKRIAHHDRWIDHLNLRLTYERAMLTDAGGIESDRTKPEKGGACKCWASPRWGWSYIVKVNKVSVTVWDNWGNGGDNFTRTMPFDKLSSLMTAAEVEQARNAGRLIETKGGVGFFVRDEVAA